VLSWCSHITLLAFLVNTLGPIPTAQAQEFRLPTPGVMVHLSPPLDPPILKGIKVHPDDPFRFDFILDKGDSGLSVETPLMASLLKQEATKLIKYFLASLTVPETDLWVNLSPYEKNRIIPNSFGLTEMGRDLLAEDYMLKQITASLIYPEDSIGKKFWKRIYQEAQKKFGTTNIPVNTFNKVWIVPEKAVVYENAKAGTAYVVESKLKVMLEQDYLALSKNTVILSVAKDLKTPLDSSASPQNDVNALGSQVVREIVIPELTREVNEGKNFFQLRQVFNSLILATWYKKKIKDSILEQVYADKNKVVGVQYASTNDVEAIYQRYLRAFKKGVYNYIKEDVDPLTQEVIPRKYFSGGVQLDLAQGATNMEHAQLEYVTEFPDKAMLNNTFGKFSSMLILGVSLVTAALNMNGQTVTSNHEGTNAPQTTIKASENYIDILIRSKGPTPELKVSVYFQLLHRMDMNDVQKLASLGPEGISILEESLSDETAIHYRVDSFESTLNWLNTRAVIDFRKAVLGVLSKNMRSGDFMSLLERFKYHNSFASEYSRENHLRIPLNGTDYGIDFFLSLIGVGLSAISYVSYREADKTRRSFRTTLDDLQKTDGADVKGKLEKIQSVMYQWHESQMLQIIYSDIPNEMFLELRSMYQRAQDQKLKPDILIGILRVTAIFNSEKRIRNLGVRDSLWLNEMFTFVADALQNGTSAGFPEYEQGTFMKTILSLESLNQFTDEKMAWDNYGSETTVGLRMFIRYLISSGRMGDILGVNNEDLEKLALEKALLNTRSVQTVNLLSSFLAQNAPSNEARSKAGEIIEAIAKDKHKDPHIRSAIFEKCFQFLEEGSIKGVILDETDAPLVRNSAIKAASLHHSSELKYYLAKKIEIIVDRSVKRTLIRRLGLWGLGHYLPDFKDPLSRIIGNPEDSDLRRDAVIADAFITLGHGERMYPKEVAAEAIQYLEGMINDEHEEMSFRVNAIYVLEKVNTQETNNILIRIAKSQLPLNLRWMALEGLIPARTDGQLKEEFKGDISGIFEDKLVEVILKKLWQLPSDEQGIKTVHGILNLANLSPGLKIKLTPWLLLEFYRQPGHSGDYPFFTTSWGDSQKTEIYKFVASLTVDDLLQLREINTPGVMEIIETIRSNPDTFNRRVVGPRDEPNPAFSRLEKSIIKTCHALESDENQSYMLNIFNRMAALDHLEHFLSLYNPSLLKDLDKVLAVWRLWDSTRLMISILKDPNNNHLFSSYTGNLIEISRELMKRMDAMAAIKHLSDRRDMPEAGVLINEIAKDPIAEESVRISAIGALGNTRSVESVHTLMEIGRNETNVNIRNACLLGISNSFTNNPHLAQEYPKVAGIVTAFNSISPQTGELFKKSLLLNVILDDRQMEELTEGLTQWQKNENNLNVLLSLVPSNYSKWPALGFTTEGIVSLFVDVINSGVTSYVNTLEDLMELCSNQETYKIFRDFMVNHDIDLNLRMKVADDYLEIMSIEQLARAQTSQFGEDLRVAVVETRESLDQMIGKISVVGTTSSSRRKIQAKSTSTMENMRVKFLRYEFGRDLSAQETAILKIPEIKKQVLTVLSILSRAGDPLLRKVFIDSLQVLFLAYDEKETDALEKARSKQIAFIRNFDKNNLTRANADKELFQKSNNEIREELIAAGYKKELWEDQIQVETTVSAGITEEKKRESIRQASFELVETAIALGVKVINGKEISLKMAGEIDNYEKVNAFLEGLRSAVPQIPEDRADRLEDILHYIQRKESEPIVTTQEETKFTVVIERDPLKLALAGLGVPGCFSPNGIHKEMPPKHALEVNAGFIQIYNESGRQVANAVIVYGKEGVYVYSGYNSSSYDMNYVFGRGLAELAKYVPRLIIYPGAPGYDYLKQYGHMESEPITIVKSATIFKEQYYDHGVVDEQGNLTVTVNSPLVVTEQSIRAKGGFEILEAGKTEVVNENKESKLPEIDFQNLANMFLDTVTDYQVNKAGGHWADVVEKLKAEGWAEQISPTELRLNANLEPEAGRMSEAFEGPLWATVFQPLIDKRFKRYMFLITLLKAKIKEEGRQDRLEDKFKVDDDLYTWVNTTVRKKFKSEVNMEVTDQVTDLMIDFLDQQNWPMDILTERNAAMSVNLEKTTDRAMAVDSAMFSNTVFGNTLKSILLGFMVFLASGTSHAADTEEIKSPPAQENITNINLVVNGSPVTLVGHLHFPTDEQQIDKDIRYAQSDGEVIQLVKKYIADNQSTLIASKQDQKFIGNYISTNRGIAGDIATEDTPSNLAKIFKSHDSEDFYKRMKARLTPILGPDVTDEYLSIRMDPVIKYRLEHEGEFTNINIVGFESGYLDGLEMTLAGQIDKAKDNQVRVLLIKRFIDLGRVRNFDLKARVREHLNGNRWLLYFIGVGHLEMTPAGQEPPNTLQGLLTQPERDISVVDLARKAINDFRGDKKADTIKVTFQENVQAKDKDSLILKSTDPQEIILNGPLFRGLDREKALTSLGEKMRTILKKGESKAKVSSTGGIDLTPANLHLQIQNTGMGIKFHMDPAMLAQLQNAPGFSPVIINMQPMKDLRQFLGIPEDSPAIPASV